jgi:hypothetical protein
LPGRSYRKLNLLLGETRPPSHSSPATMAAGGGRERGRWGSQRREGSRRASRHRGKAIHARAKWRPTEYSSGMMIGPFERQDTIVAEKYKNDDVRPV